MIKLVVMFMYGCETEVDHDKLKISFKWTSVQYDIKILFVGWRWYMEADNKVYVLSLLCTNVMYFVQKIHNDVTAFFN